LIYMGTDPVLRELELHDGVRAAFDLLEPHCAFFTWAANYGKDGYRLPMFDRFPFQPTRQPLLRDIWESDATDQERRFTTIAGWRQLWREVTFEGEVYHWSKHHEFLKVIDLPRRTPQPFELALGSYEPADKQLLEDHGWRVHDSLDVSVDLDAYRHYICHSRGEFTVAKDQNVRLRSGWFSERSAQYLAAGRPVITQETGFSNSLPTGEGLFGFSSTDDILDAVEAINSDYARHSRAAREIAREHFSYEVVLRRLLDEAGL